MPKAPFDTPAMTFNLNNPYPFESSVSKRWKKNVAVSGFVFLFLLLYQPFGLNTLKQDIFTAALGYGVTCFVAMSVLNIAVVSVFPKHFSEENWTTIKALLWTTFNIAVIGIANAVYSAFIEIGDLSFYNLFWFEVYALALGIFPTGVTILINQARLKNKFEKESDAINLVFNKKKETITEKDNLPELTIYSENGKDNLSLFPHDLLFIRASDNYVEVFYATKNGCNYKLIRNSLKSITDLLALQVHFFRCHKSYLVNLKKVTRVSGNAQGYKLHLSDTDELIPVSRIYNETIKKRFTAYP